MKNKLKKQKPEIIEWGNLKVGDFIESNGIAGYRMFCFRNNGYGPSCLGRMKNPSKSNPTHPFDGAYVGGGILEYTRMKPPKSFVKLCKRLLKLNLEENQIDNL